MADRKTPLWHAAHFNALAKEIRELFPIGNDGLEIPYNQIERTILSTLALNLAKRFQAEREEVRASGGQCYDFDPVRFLDACSPNTDLYPLSELWED